MIRNSPSAGRPPFRRPTILIGTDTSLLGRPAVSPQQATSAGLYGMDLDLRRSWRSPADVEAARVSIARIRSVWLPIQYTGPLAETRAERLSDFLRQAVTQNGLRTVVVPGPTTARQQGVALGSVARQLAERQPVRVAMGVDAEDILRRPGSHLDHVANLRRMAEEWDLDIAIDLTSHNLGQWESEATLMRLFPRLVLVRLCPLHDGGGARSAAPEAMTATRTIAMLADQAYGGLVSVTASAPGPAWLSWLIRPNLDLAELARQEILQTYDRIDQYDISSRQAHQQRP